MPELPEVETIRRQLKGRLEGHTIGDAWGFDSPKFATAAESAGARLGRLRRRGKYLLVDLFDQEAGQDPEAGQEPPRRELVIHLGMTGRLAVVRNGDRPQGCADRHLRARFELDDGSYLGMWDLRRFGRAVVVPTGEYRSLPTLAALGPEPFSAEFTPAALRVGLSGRKAIKTALMDQRVVAGVGNIYADEALWRSGIRPTAPAGTGARRAPPARRGGGARAGGGQWRHDAARLPRCSRRGGLQPAPALLLRTPRTALPALRSRAAPRRARRPEHHLLRPVPDLSAPPRGACGPTRGLC
ncbi:MAG: DNA-formamidopyrimidine glycosylase family protein [Microthrixaceae bacterium]